MQGGGLRFLVIPLNPVLHAHQVFIITASGIPHIQALITRGWVSDETKGKWRPVFQHASLLGANVNSKDLVSVPSRF